MAGYGYPPMMDEEDDKPEQAGFTTEDAKQGYWREDMYEYPVLRPGVMRRNHMKGMYRDDY